MLGSQGSIGPGGVTGTIGAVVGVATSGGVTTGGGSGVGDFGTGVNGTVIGGGVDATGGGVSGVTGVTGAGPGIGGTPEFGTTGGGTFPGVILIPKPFPYRASISAGVIPVGSSTP